MGQSSLVAAVGTFPSASPSLLVAGVKIPYEVVVVRKSSLLADRIPFGLDVAVYRASEPLVRYHYVHRWTETLAYEAVAVG